MGRTRPNCSIEGCLNIHHSSGMCRKHKRRMISTGSPYNVKIDQAMQQGQAGLNFLYYSYQKNAQKRKITFFLSKEDFTNLTKQNCSYCGTEPKNICNPRSKRGQYIYNGIDRLDSKVGYKKENCVPCCKTCNMLKGPTDLNEFLKHLNKIVKYTKSILPEEPDYDFADQLVQEVYEEIVRK